MRRFRFSEFPEKQGITEEEKQECVKDTIAWCNTIRKSQGRPPILDLPRGKRGDGRSCPCGEAAGVIVGRMFYRPSNNTDESPFSEKDNELPVGVSNFTWLFDEGQFPQYDLEEVEEICKSKSQQQ